MPGYALAIVIGFVFGIFVMGAATDQSLERRIKAGVFEADGIAYTIKPLNGE